MQHCCQFVWHGSCHQGFRLKSVSHKAATAPRICNQDPGCPISVQASVSITNQHISHTPRAFWRSRNNVFKYVMMSRHPHPAYCKTSTFYTIRASSYVTIVCWLSAIQKRHQKYHVGYLIKRCFDTETSKSEPGTITYTRNRRRYRLNR